jgi:predicted enzyme related to lactoylglutathione lyase
MYLCVRDMERAIHFYRRFLEASPIEKDEIFSVFDVGGFRLGLFAYGKMGEAHTFGDNCLPSIEVESETRFLAKLQTVEVVYGPKPIGCYLVAEFIDSEGNRIELTTRKESAG